MRRRSVLSLLGLAALAWPSAFASGQEPLGRNETITRNTQRNDQVADFWIYGDLQAGFARARETGKPLLVTYRCVP